MAGWYVLSSVTLKDLLLFFPFSFFSSFQRKRKTNSSVCAMEFQNLYLLLFL